jgi:hypothetical protein
MGLWEILLVHIEQCLVPTLKRNDILVMDDLRTYDISGMRQAIETTDARVRYLPQCSPDSPIEMPLSKIKSFLRKFSKQIRALYKAARSERGDILALHHANLLLLW